MVSLRQEVAASQQMHPLVEIEVEIEIEKGSLRRFHQNPSPRWGAFRPSPERKAL
jgi:hypothetical protein